MKKTFVLTIITIFLTGTLLAQTFRKGPYLLYSGNNTEMTVLWQSDVSTSSQISWGTTQSYGNSQTVTEYGTDHQFKIILSGLSPGTKYYYKVQVGATLKNETFITTPLATEKNISFYIYGDTRAHPEVQNSVTGRIITEINNDTASQSFCLITGDCVTHGRTENDWQNQFFNATYQNNEILKSSLPFMIARGNHENYNANYNNGFATVFYKYWPYLFASGSTNGDKMYYSFDYGPVHIAVLDQYDNGSYNPAQVSSTQLSWLQTDLANTNKPWKFILLHEPGWSAKYTSRSEHGNNADVQNNIQPLCVQYDVQAVFGGHNHYYAHCLVNGVHHFTLGGGGAPLYNPSHTSGGVIVYAEKTYHFMKVKIENNDAILTVLRPDGSVVETINLTLPLGIAANPLSDNPIKVYPNPSADGMFTIETKSNGFFSVNTLMGQTLFTKNSGSQKTEIDLSDYPKGIYSIEFFTHGKIYYKKVIKE